MSSDKKLPYIVQPGVITKILIKIREAKVPDRFTQDYLRNTLGLKGGNYRQFISLAKKLAFLNSDGTPTDLYKAFRNPSSSKAAMAEAIRQGYKELFERNELAGDLDKDELKGHIVEITGLGPKDRIVQLICQTFEILKSEANFDQKLAQAENENNGSQDEVDNSANQDKESSGGESGVDLRLGYTINLVLPKTDDPAVFNAIFKSLRENLLRK